MKVSFNLIAYRVGALADEMEERFIIAICNQSISYGATLWSYCDMTLGQKAWTEVVGIAGESGEHCICVVGCFSILHDN